MALKKVKAVVDNFISNGNNDLLILKGLWGVGKTFFWHSQIREAIANGNVKYSNYAYVSLFGINCLEELKNSIFVANQSTNVEINTESNKGWQATIKYLAAQLEKFPKIREYTGGLGSNIAFSTIHDTIICFDDFERKGDELKTKDFLGIVSLLKEQRNCKIIIILNEESLRKTDKQDFLRDAEKITDISMAFETDIDYGFPLVFSATELYFTQIYDLCKLLQITNIRILIRIRRFINDILQLLVDSEESVIFSVIHSVILFVWCYYNKDGQTPTLDFIKKYEYGSAFMKKENLSEEEISWLHILHNYKYQFTSKLDLVLADYIEKGYLDTDLFLELIKEENLRVITKLGQDHYYAAWNIYSNSFDNNEEEFIKELEASFRVNMHCLSIMNLDSTVDTLRYFGKDDRGDKLVDDYFEMCMSKNLILGDFEFPSFTKPKDPYLMKRLSEILIKTKPNKELKEVVDRISSQNGWNIEDEDFLASCNSEDYYDFFKSENSEKLKVYINWLLDFGRHGKNDEKRNIVYKSVQSALIKIANENPINRFRVTNLYEIDLGSPSIQS